MGREWMGEGVIDLSNVHATHRDEIILHNAHVWKENGGALRPDSLEEAGARQPEDAQSSGLRKLYHLRVKPG